MLGKKIKNLRIVKGMKQEYLAKKSGVSKPYISQLESGKANNPSINKIQKLAKALEIPVLYFLERSESKNLEYFVAQESLSLYLENSNISAEEQKKLNRLTQKMSGRNLPKL